MVGTGITMPMTTPRKKSDTAPCATTDPLGENSKIGCHAKNGVCTQQRHRHKPHVRLQCIKQQWHT